LKQTTYETNDKRFLRSLITTFLSLPLPLSLSLFIYISFFLFSRYNEQYLVDRRENNFLCSALARVLVLDTYLSKLEICLYLKIIKANLEYLYPFLREKC